jgi:Thermolysin metallopeptidase, alpha-helical domain
MKGSHIVLEGPNDKGGVHNNSGIMNLAFALTVKGGYHPNPGPGVSGSIYVPPIDFDFDASLSQAARIWYWAEVACLTSSSQFLDARQCTLLYAGPFATSVAAAWDAVGVIPPIPPTQAPTPRPTPPPTPRPTPQPVAVVRLTNTQCLEQVKRKCNCSDFLKLKSTCWRSVVNGDCKIVGTNPTSVLRKMWRGFCLKSK